MASLVSMKIVDDGIFFLGMAIFGRQKNPVRFISLKNRAVMNRIRLSAYASGTCQRKENAKSYYFTVNESLFHGRR